MSVWPWPPIFHIIFFSWISSFRSESQERHESYVSVYNTAAFGDLKSTAVATAAPAPALHNKYELFFCCVYANRIQLEIRAVVRLNLLVFTEMNVSSFCHCCSLESWFEVRWLPIFVITLSETWKRTCLITWLCEMQILVRIRNAFSQNVCVFFGNNGTLVSILSPQKIDAIHNYTLVAVVYFYNIIYCLFMQWPCRIASLLLSFSLIHLNRRQIDGVYVHVSMWHVWKFF